MEQALWADGEQWGRLSYLIFLLLFQSICLLNINVIMPWRPDSHDCPLLYPIFPHQAEFTTFLQTPPLQTNWWQYDHFTTIPNPGAWPECFWGSATWRWECTKNRTEAVRKKREQCCPFFMLFLSLSPVKYFGKQQQSNIKPTWKLKG